MFKNKSYICKSASGRNGVTDGAREECGGVDALIHFLLKYLIKYTGSVRRLDSYRNLSFQKRQDGPVIFFSVNPLH